PTDYRPGRPPGRPRHGPAKRRHQNHSEKGRHRPAVRLTDLGHAREVARFVDEAGDRGFVRLPGVGPGQMNSGNEELLSWPPFREESYCWLELPLSLAGG